MKRDQVLPVDLEREAHEEEDRRAHREDGFELDVNEKREMEALEQALEGVGGGQIGKKEVGRWEGKTGEELVEWFQVRLTDLEERALRI